MTQAPDTKPGYAACHIKYYVTAIDGKRHARLAGPFRDDHKAALDMVDATRKIAQEGRPSDRFLRLRHLSSRPRLRNPRRSQ